MLNLTLEQYTEALDKTLPKLKDVLFADHTSTAIKSILNRHNAEDNSLDVSAIIGYILVGLLPVKKIIEILQEEADLDQKTAHNVAYEIREQIFGPVAQDLANIQSAAQLNWQNMLFVTESDSVGAGDESVVGEKIVSLPKQTKQTSKDAAPPSPSNLPVQGEKPKI